MTLTNLIVLLHTLRDDNLGSLDTPVYICIDGDHYDIGQISITKCYDGELKNDSQDKVVINFQDKAV